jgi:DNA-binding transcriptional MerR regulator
METYTLAEFAKTMGVSPKIIKQWEKNFKTYISIPRTKQGARIYTEAEADFFQNIKALYEKKLKKYEIINYLQSQGIQTESTCFSQEENAGEQMAVNGEMMEVHSVNKDFQETSLHLKEELREEVYVSNIMKKEKINQTHSIISSPVSDLKSCTQKISDQHEAATHTFVHLMEAEHHAQAIQDPFQNTKIEMSEEILQEEREHSLSTLEHEQKIMERERAFRELVLSFRGAAAAEMKKPKKWWKFWTMSK